MLALTGVLAKLDNINYLVEKLGDEIDEIALALDTEEE